MTLSATAVRSTGLAFDGARCSVERPGGFGQGDAVLAGQDFWISPCLCRCPAGGGEFRQ